MVRNILQVALSLLLWALFVFYWQLVARRPMNSDTTTALITLGALSFLTIVFISFWVFHNIRLYRRFGPRVMRPVAPRMPIRDFMGRWVIIENPDRLRAADYIEIDIRSTVVDGMAVEEKIFRASRSL